MRTQEPLRHELISASAGSGKTFQLVRRYLHLMALGVDPTTVAAMTFTRKAAGEFFNRILNQLAKLADGEVDPAQYFAGLSPAVPSQVPYLSLLRQLTLQMQRLRLGTLDSFFASITTCFPLELGLPAGASVMTEEDTQRQQDQAIDQWLEHLRGHRDDEATSIVLEGIKQSSFGSEEKRTEDALRAWVKDGQDLWVSRSSDASWGRMDQIWPGRLDRAEAPAYSPESLINAAIQIRNTFPSPKPGALKFLDEVVEQAPLFRPCQKPPPRIAFLLEKTTPIWAALLSGEASLTWNRQHVTLSGAAAAAWIAFVEILLALELQMRALRTRGVALILKRFEQTYHEAIRSRGLLSFADVPRLLHGMPEQVRDHLWFRLDGRYEHWMFDEFQDTSFLQWDVVQPLVDEVLQDPEGRRSFFAVGDPKQSIYLWRQAEPGLFDELLEAYPENPVHRTGLHLGALARSYRSCPPVLHAVNTTFEDLSRIQQLLPGAEKVWHFTHHESSQPEMTGCARLISHPQIDDPDSEGPKPLHELAAALLRDLQPLARRLTCAVLVRGNKTALALAESLRTLTDMPVVCESEQHPATDNAVTLALLSILQLAAHPGDRFALEHLRMTPLTPWFEHPSSVITRTLTQIASHGFAAFVQSWTDHLSALDIELDDFHRLRLRQLADMAAEFDETGSRDIDLFLTTVRERSLRTRGLSHAIQVMTVHASKGLEFDIVIMPDLETDGMDTARHANWLVNRDRGITQWVLQTPTSEFVALDPVLSQHQTAAKETASFESLCQLYVAMTRAKRGLYLLAAPAPASPRSMKPIRFLREMLGTDTAEPLEIAGVPAAVEWQTGMIDWHHEHPVHVAPAPRPITATPEPLGKLLQAVQPRQRRVTPSGQESFTLPGSVLFSLGRDAGRRLGNQVHEQLSHIAWWTAEDPLEKAFDLWRTAGLLADDDAISLEAAALSGGALQSPECAAAFSPADSDAIVWREKPFDLIHDGDWVSGTFDRLMVTRHKAHLIDFKTDAVGTPEALADKVRGYTPQLKLYRRAASRLTGLAESAIDVSLLFVRVPSLVKIDC